ncbi:MogA/MoaB family molybdenum cofactor biosynthesis protein [Desulfovulcanus ferrireducens]|jgi:molybdenum cofactor synthesis domain-containing protein|uniref:MogA/MoaB family molybdenum cofactor biosynthesis protein n=1 Tax=Desulfovulcanus ferrireducens TaxID=2831190 RepID=UPI00207BB9A1|nr:MogA/MoaB family molybdenum cofactor biosynthesis protein [Desulfovulcanus ferrireducens]
MIARLTLCVDKEIHLRHGETVYFQVVGPKLESQGLGTAVYPQEPISFPLLLHSTPLLTCFGEAKELKVGLYLGEAENFFQIIDKRWVPGPDGKNYLLFAARVIKDISINGSMELCVYKHGYSLAWITLSDKGSQGLREDKSGPLIAKLVAQKINISMVHGFVLPDESYELKALLTHLALFWGIDLIMTTGGTGVGPRDITPEATLAVIEKRLTGFEQAMISTALTKTVHGMISRAVVGTLHESLIVNLPGSPKAVQENLGTILPALEHTLRKLQGDKTDCGRN